MRKRNVMESNILWGMGNRGIDVDEVGINDIAFALHRAEGPI